MPASVVETASRDGVGSGAAFCLFGASDSAADIRSPRETEAAAVAAAVRPSGKLVRTPDFAALDARIPAGMLKAANGEAAPEATEARASVAVKLDAALGATSDAAASLEAGPTAVMAAAIRDASSGAGDADSEGRPSAGWTTTGCSGLAARGSGGAADARPDAAALETRACPTEVVGAVTGAALEAGGGCVGGALDAGMTNASCTAFAGVEGALEDMSGASDKDD
ncbi:MAG: hypothetical protein ACHQAY_16080 [Hyphomicrobiales bacterium]